MATQTGSTYISQSMIDIVVIPTANPMANSKRMSVGDSNNDRQPEILWERALKFQRQIWSLRPCRAQKSQQMTVVAADNRKQRYDRQNRKYFISGTMTYSIEILTTNLGFEHDELDRSVAKWLRQRRTTGNGKIDAQNGYIAILVVARCRNRLWTLSSSWPRSPLTTTSDMTLELWYCLSEFYRHYHFRFDGRNIISGCASVSRLFADTFFLSLPWSKTLLFPLELGYNNTNNVLRRHSSVWVNASVKFRQFQNNLRVFDDTSNNFRCTDQRSDCCILCPIHIPECH